MESKPMVADVYDSETRRRLVANAGDLLAIVRRYLEAVDLAEMDAIDGDACSLIYRIENE